MPSVGALESARNAYKPANGGRAMPVFSLTCSKVVIRLTCASCNESVLMDRDVLVKQLGSITLATSNALLLEGCPQGCDRVVTFRCDDCTMVLVREAIPLQVN